MEREKRCTQLVDVCDRVEAAHGDQLREGPDEARHHVAQGAEGALDDDAGQGSSSCELDGDGTTE
jgi:hypothetical protein